MLAVSPLTNSYKDGREGERGGGDELFLDFSGDSLLDSIDFDDLFDGDVLPDLEMDPELLAEFSLSGGEDSNGYTSASFERADENSDEKVSGSASSLLNQGDEIVSKRDDEQVPALNLTPKEPRDKGKKSSSQSKNHQAKRKVKVDWTPELHRRFVQAVEQLGVDKAVPSRILELMGIDCLTRHNIASHLQKYRSHRKHMLAREAEAANWSQKRQIYSGAGGGGGGGGGGGTKREMNNSPWLPIAPTMCYPPMAPMPHHFRHLHVWGHPPVDQSLAHIWSKHIAPSPHPPHIWPPSPPSHPPVPPRDPSYWHAHQRHVPNSVTAGTPYYPPPAIAPTRFPAPPVPGIPHHAMYKLDPSIGVPTTPTCPKPPLDFHPSKESVDEIIGDVLSKPWLPLPIGLNPPSLDSVMVELNHQGIQKVPPTCG